MTFKALETTLSQHTVMNRLISHLKYWTNKQKEGTGRSLQHCYKLDKYGMLDLEDPFDPTLPLNV